LITDIPLIFYYTGFCSSWSPIWWPIWWIQWILL